MVRTAIIGLGKVAERIHIPACRAVPSIELVAACEPDTRRRQQMQARFAIPRAYDDALTLLERERPELVIIGAPPSSHKDLCLAALRHGANVLCEKPFVLSLAEADEVIAEARRCGRQVAVNTQYRHMAIYRTAREELVRGTFGRLFFVQCWQQMYHPPARETGSWRAELKQSTLYEFGPHPLDLICGFFQAYPTAVTAVIPRVAPEHDADVLVQLTLRFPGERLATLALNRVSHAPERYLEMRLDCERASLRLSLGGVARAGWEMVRSRHGSRPQLRLSLVRGGEARVEANGRSRVLAREPRVAVASATAAHLRAFLAHKQCESDDYNGYASVEHARAILRIIFAGYESARTGQTVTL